ncbi:hypothetical protein L917_09574 [Phytophthora nicotianae]|uniref:Secreted protein n=1 Tax=Phytophthora nicotianae TaxID=4792 RepID=W2L3Q1_PHYNI|nr:hypothetical protein L915_09747 [Phytophthora nicotianae]ETL38863.1 hypothetical protein L916_09652 [Phytophthora nicotianae]ETL91987.1 hypothetical protein L917_09574 [Phytophthora nicotianae]ETM45283.1 hypothetical protein L914_09617 [Phytophthora nicotianae]
MTVRTHLRGISSSLLIVRVLCTLLLDDAAPEVMGVFLTDTCHGFVSCDNVFEQYSFKIPY